jgi:hypothetical protein
MDPPHFQSGQRVENINENATDIGQLSTDPIADKEDWVK